MIPAGTTVSLLTATKASTKDLEQAQLPVHPTHPSQGAVKTIMIALTATGN